MIKLKKNHKMTEQEKIEVKVLQEVLQHAEFVGSAKLPLIIQGMIAERMFGLMEITK